MEETERKGWQKGVLLNKNEKKRWSKWGRGGQQKLEGFL